MSEVLTGWGVYDLAGRDPPEVHVVEEVMREFHDPVTTCPCQPRVEVQENGSLVVVHGEGEERPA